MFPFSGFVFEGGVFVVGFELGWVSRRSSFAVVVEFGFVYVSGPVGRASYVGRVRVRFVAGVGGIFGIF